MYTLLPLFVLFVMTSFYRFMALQDYMVAYEAACDPYDSECFAGCEDDECTAKYYYAQVTKYAPYVMAECGINITDCEAAASCTPEDKGKCSILYCVANDETECETLTASDRPTEEDFSVENTSI